MSNLKNKQERNVFHSRLYSLSPTSLSLTLSLFWILFGFQDLGESVGFANGSAAEIPVATVKPLKVEVRLLSGSTIEGELLKCQAGEISIALKDGDKAEVAKFATADVAMLVMNDVSTIATGAGHDILRLSDGTSVHCNSLEGKDNSWTVESASGITFNATPSMLSVLQLRDISSTLRDAIDRGMTTSPVTDEMLIKRPGDTIDKIQGVIMGLDESVATFSFDGQTIPAPRAKLAGLVWAQPNEVTFKPTIRVRTKDGSKWEATDLSYDYAESETGTLFQWKLRCGGECQCKPSEIVSIDYSNAIVRWLAAIPALEKKSRDNPFLATPFDGRKNLLSPYFSSQANVVDASDEMSIKNLVFPVDGEFLTRVPEGTSRFRSKIVRPDDAKVQGNIRCEVWSNDQQIWSSQNTTQESPWIVDVAVIAEKRVRLVVLSDAGLSIGSMVTWLQPRFSP